MSGEYPDFSLDDILMPDYRRRQGYVGGRALKAHLAELRQRGHDPAVTANARARCSWCGQEFWLDTGEAVARCAESGGTA